MFETNPEAQRIIQDLSEALAALSNDLVIDYKTLNQIAGVDVKSKKRYLLTSAIEQTEKTYGCIFACVRKFGIKRLPPSQSPEIGLESIRKCRSAAKRGKRRLDRISANSLSESEQRAVIGYSAMLGAVALISDGRKASAVAAVADPHRSIPPENILAMFQTKGG